MKPFVCLKNFLEKKILIVHIFILLWLIGSIFQCGLGVFDFAWGQQIIVLFMKVLIQSCCILRAQGPTQPLKSN